MQVSRAEPARAGHRRLRAGLANAVTGFAGSPGFPTARLGIRTGSSRRARLHAPWTTSTATTSSSTTAGPTTSGSWRSPTPLRGRQPPVRRPDHAHARHPRRGVSRRRVHRARLRHQPGVGLLLTDEIKGKPLADVATMSPDRTSWTCWASRSAPPGSSARCCRSTPSSTALDGAARRRGRGPGMIAASAAAVSAAA